MLITDLAAHVPVVVSDDASPCTSDPTLNVLRGMGNVTVVRHGANQGIARGLNDGLRAAVECGAEWLLTVDQDSRLVDGYLETLLAEIERRKRLGARIGAIGAERILDASGELTYPLSWPTHGPITEELIQTATMWRVDALAELGGFDESLGIDGVDAGACLGLRRLGYDIAVVEGTHVHHVIGAARMVNLLGRPVMVTGHAGERRSSMLRNRLRLFPAEFRQSPKHAFRTLRRVAVNHGLGIVSSSARRGMGSLPS